MYIIHTMLTCLYNISYVLLKLNVFQDMDQTTSYA